MDNKACNDLICPFCYEDDFDKIGLKIHLARGYCKEFEDINITEIEHFLWEQE